MLEGDRSFLRFPCSRHRYVLHCTLCLLAAFYQLFRCSESTGANDVDAAYALLGVPRGAPQSRIRKGYTVRTRARGCSVEKERGCSVQKESATVALMCGGAQDAALRNYHLYVELEGSEYYNSIECARLMHRWLSSSVPSKQLPTCGSSYPLFLHHATLAAVRLLYHWRAWDWGCCEAAECEGSVLTSSIGRLTLLHK